MEDPIKHGMIWGGKNSDFWRATLKVSFGSPLTNLSSSPSEVRIYPAGKSSQEAWQLGSSAIRGLAMKASSEPGSINSLYLGWETSNL